MYELSPEQVKLIVIEVNRENITYSHLRDDLIDHVCCDLEYEMEKGLSFAEAFVKVKQKIGINGLRKIQTETLFIVDSKYRFMKKTMKISGITGTILLGFAALFKIMHWEGAGVLIMLGALVLNFMFLPSSLSVLYKESKSGKRILLFLTAFLSAFFFITGVLFKIQHWTGASIIICLAVLFAALFLPQLLAMKLKETAQPQKRPVYITGFIGAYAYLFGMLFKFQHWFGAGVLYFLGAILLFGLAFPWYAWLSWKEESYVHTSFIFLVTAVTWVMVTSGLINLNVSYNYLESFSREFERQEAITSFLLEQNNKVTANVSDTVLRTKLSNIHQKSQGIFSQIQQLKVHMVQMSPGTQVNADPKDPSYLYNQSMNQFDSRSPMALLAGTSPERQKLEHDILSYRSLLLQETGANSALTEGLGDLMQPDVCLPDTGKVYTMILGNCLNQLSMLQNSILLGELQVITQLEKPVIETIKSK